MVYARRGYKKKAKRRKLIGIMTIFLLIIGLCMTLNHTLRNNSVIAYKEEISLPPEIIESNDPIVQALVEEANSDGSVEKILNNIESYPKELLELAAKKPETREFVANYTDKINESRENISVKQDYKKGEIPLFIQWDERWGYDLYGSDYIAINGCAPTTLAMVAVGLTGDTDINPKVVADFAYNNGYFVEGVGSAWTLVSEGAKNFGLNAEEIPLDESIILSTIREGNPIIVTVGPGTFTTAGHFMVLTGVTDDNKIIINDPDSRMKSKETWDIDVFMKETRNLWKITTQ